MIKRVLATLSIFVGGILAIIIGLLFKMIGIELPEYLSTLILIFEVVSIFSIWLLSPIIDGFRNYRLKKLIHKNKVLREKQYHERQLEKINYVNIQEEKKEEIN